MAELAPDQRAGWSPGHLFCRRFERGRGQEAVFVLVRFEQSLDLPAQFLIARAGPVEECRTLRNSQFQGGIGQPVNLLITFGSHY